MNSICKSFRHLCLLTLYIILIFTLYLVMPVYADDPQLSYVEMSAVSYSMSASETTQLTITGVMDDGTPASLTSASISYSSSNTSIASVSSSGLVTAVSPGIASITAEVTLSGVTKSRSVCIVVNTGVIFSDGFEDGLLEWEVLYDGHPQVKSSLKHSGDFSLKITDDIEGVTKSFDASFNSIFHAWFYDDGSSNKACVAQTTNIIAGVLTSVSGNYYVVRYGYPATYVTTEITRNIGWHQVVADYTSQSAVEVYIDGIQVSTIQGYEDFSSIYLSDNWAEHYYSGMFFDDIAIYKISDYLGRVTASSSSFNLNVDETAQLYVSGYMEDGTSANLSLATISYQSSNSGVASVSSSGLITAVSAGTAEITAIVQLNGVVKTCTYNIRVFSASVTLDKVILSSNKTNMKPGTSSTLLVTGYFSDSTTADLRGFSGSVFTFSSSKTSVAEVNSSGVIAAVSPGISNITVSALLNGVSKSRNISIIVNNGILFNESFENGFSEWQASTPNPVISSGQALRGGYSIKSATDSSYLTKNFDRDYSDVFEGWFYDDNATNKVAVFAIGGIMVGPVYNVSSSYYVVRDGSNYITTNIPRDAGWHQVVCDFTTSGGALDVYIDGQPALQLSGYESFDYIYVGDLWSDEWISNAYFDNINVYTTTSSSAKTLSTYYTSEKVSAARTNINEYDWAQSIKDVAVQNAQTYVDLSDDELWYLVTQQSLPRGYAVNQTLGCPYCGTAINSYGPYPYVIDPIDDPWKIECPNCHKRFPTNDFESYYLSGIDENGNFDEDKADQSLLVNTLYPEMGSTWGVEDGMGWINTTGAKFTIIAYYNHWGVWFSASGPGVIQNALDTLRLAYVYTGDLKYAHAGIILLDRVADVYPSMDIADYPYQEGYLNSDGLTGKGKVLGQIWETILAKSFIYAYDAFFPAMESTDSVNVVPYLSEKAKQYHFKNTKDSVAAIKRNIEDNILRVIYPACQNAQIYGNSGMHQSTLALAAVVLDEEGTSKDWIDWVFQSGEFVVTPDYHVTGGDLNNILVNLVDRDGYGNEGSCEYNAIWISNMKMVADILKGYYRYPEYDLYNNVKFKKLFETNYSLLMLDKYVPNIGDSGYAGKPISLVTPEYAIDAFDYYGDPIFAQYAYFINRNLVEGLHGSIFSTDPEQIAAEIQDSINQNGELDIGSTINTGFNFAALRDGDNIKDYGTRYGFLYLTINDSSGEACVRSTRYKTLIFAGWEIGSYIEFNFDVTTAGTYEVDLLPFKDSNYGQYDIYIDDGYIGQYDFYGLGTIGYQESIIGSLQLTTGSHRIKFVCTGKNTSSSGFRAGLIEFALLTQQDQEDKNIAMQIGNRERGVTLYDGVTINHGHRSALNLGIYAFGLDLSPDNGYPEYTGPDPKRIEWTSNSSSHNVVMVDKNKQVENYSGIPKNFESSDIVQFIDVEAPDVYTSSNLYRRSITTIKVDEENSYILDIFRVKGGNEHHYIFHGPEGTVTTGGLSLVDQTTGTYMGADVAYGQCIDDYDESEWIYNGCGFHYLYNVQKDSTSPSDFYVDWDVTDTWMVLPEPEDVHLRMHCISTVNDAALCDGEPPQKPGCPESIKYVIGHRSGSNLESQFVNIFEPYVDNTYIESIEKLSITTSQSGISDKDAYAVKVTLKNGRVDYIMNALDPNVLYRVDNQFDFKGSLGYYSEKDGVMVSAYLVDGTLLEKGTERINKTTPIAITGTITDFTTDLTDDNEISVDLDESYSNPNDLVGKYIYITNDGVRNAVYQIKEIKSSNGNAVTFGIGDITLIRGYVDKYDFSQGYVYDISTGAAFRIPISEKVVEYERVCLDDSDTSMTAGSTGEIKVNGMMYDGMMVDLKEDPEATISYSSSNTSVVTVSSTGTLTAVATGVANITVNVTRGGISTSAGVSVIVYGSRVFYDNFEDNINEWTIGDGSPEISTIQKRKGAYGLKINEDREWITKSFGTSYNGVVEEWFYDDGTVPKEAVTGVGAIIVGPYHSRSDDFYVIRYGYNYITTNIPRTRGWHQVVYDFRGENTVNVYINGVSVAEVSGYETFNYISIGDFWSDSCLSDIYFDDISVYLFN